MTAVPMNFVHDDVPFGWTEQVMRPPPATDRAEGNTIWTPAFHISGVDE